MRKVYLGLNIFLFPEYSLEIYPCGQKGRTMFNFFVLQTYFPKGKAVWVKTQHPFL